MGYGDKKYGDDKYDTVLSGCSMVLAAMFLLCWMASIYFLER